MDLRNVLPYQKHVAISFGQLLTDLRSVRSITLDELADAAQVSYTTIARAVQRDKCSWRLGVRLNVLRSLNAAQRLTSRELRDYCRATGLAEDSTVVQQALGLSGPAIPPQGAHSDRTLRSAWTEFIVACEPSERAAFQLVGQIIAAVGAGDAAKILTGIAAGIEHNTTPETTSHEPALHERQRRMVFVSPFEFEGMRGTIHKPVESVRPPPERQARRDAAKGRKREAG